MSMAKYIDDMIIAALRESVKTKELNQVTVAELVRVTGINRKTFYNHFTGISDLVCSIFHAGFEEIVVGKAEPYTWDVVIKDLLHTAKRNEAFVRKVLESKYAAQVRQCIQQDLNRAVMDYIRKVKELMEKTSGDALPMARRQERYLVRFYSVLMFAMIEEWVADGMEESVDEYVDIINRLTNKGVDAGILFFSKSNETE